MLRRFVRWLLRKPAPATPLVESLDAKVRESWARGESYTMTESECAALLAEQPHLGWLLR